MAISTQGITLKSGTSYAAATKVCDITSFPDLGGAPEQIDVTTLSNEARVYIEGLQDQQALEFGANYSETDYEAVKALADNATFWLDFGTSGSAGIFTWKGSATAYVNGAGVNEAVTMTVVITPSTEVTLHDAG